MRLFLAALVSGLIVALGTPVFVLWLAPVAATIGYAIFWRALHGYSKKRKFWLGTLWFFGVELVHLSWMTSTEFQGLYILGVYLFLALALGLQFGLLTVFVEKLFPLAIASLWTLFEWVRLYFFCGFSWDPVGLSLTAFTWSMQAASLFGILGLSFWVILTNMVFLRRRWFLGCALAVIPYLFGALHILWHEPALARSAPLKVALVQTNLLPSQKMRLRGREEDFISPYLQWKQIFSLLHRKGEAFDLIVLPEYAVSFPWEAKAYSLETVRSIVPGIQGGEEFVSNRFWCEMLARRFAAEVVAGFDVDEGKRHYSSAVHVTSEGAEVYHKQVLLPLAEHLPWERLRGWSAAYGITEFFTPGVRSMVVKGRVPLSLSVCYEETFSHLMRKGRLDGGEVFVNLTNDAWYPDSRLPEAHFYHGRVRAVENGAPLLRACNTGVTAAVDSLGRTVGELPKAGAGVLVAEVPTYHYPTLYMLWGNGGILVVSLLIFACVKKNRQLV